MDVRFHTGTNPYRKNMEKLKQTVSAKVSAASPAKAQDRLRDTVKISYQHVLTAEKEGYVEINGERIAVSADTAKDMRRSYEWASAQNEAARQREQMKQERENTARQVEAAEEENKKLRQALEIFRRISKGGRVPHQDEQFLMDYSQELYMAAKLSAMLAEKHEKYDTILEDTEERTEEGGDEEYPAVYSAEMTVTAAEGPASAEAPPID